MCAVTIMRGRPLWCSRSRRNRFISSCLVRRSIWPWRPAFQARQAGAIIFPKRGGKESCATFYSPAPNACASLLCRRASWRGPGREDLRSHPPPPRQSRRRDRATEGRVGVNIAGPQSRRIPGVARAALSPLRTALCALRMRASCAGQFAVGPARWRSEPQHHRDANTAATPAARFR